MTGLQEISKGVWVYEDSMKLAGVVNMPLRMTVLRIENQDLMVIAPLAPTPELVRAIQELGQVRYIVAPNCMHHLFMNKFAAAFPGAEMWGPKDLHDKRPDIPFTHVLEGDREAPWTHAVEMVSIYAKPPMFEEVIFFHRASKTVVMTDMLFNFQRFHGLLDRWFAKLNGVYKKLIMSRLARAFFRDAQSLHKASSKILVWNPDNLIVAHGKIIRGGASVALRAPLSNFAAINS